MALHYVRIAWTDSLLWRPPVLLLLLPLAAIGTLGVSGVWRRWLLWLVVACTAAFYSVYSVTDIHPRFLYVVFPLVLVLWCTGIAVVGSVATGRQRRRRAHSARRRTTAGATATSAATVPSVSQKSTETVAPPNSAMPASTPSSDAVQAGAT